MVYTVQMATLLEVNNNASHPAIMKGNGKKVDFLENASNPVTPNHTATPAQGKEKEEQPNMGESFKPSVVFCWPHLRVLDQHPSYLHPRCRHPFHSFVSNPSFSSSGVRPDPGGPDGLVQSYRR